MTEEQIEALRDDLKKANDSISKLEEKNREVILKNKKLANQEISQDEHFKVLEQLEDLKNANSKLELTQKTNLKEIEKLTQSNEGLNKTNSKMLIDDVVIKTANSLERHNIGSENKDYKMSNIQRDIRELKPQIIDGVAMIGDKTLDNYIREDYINSAGVDNFTVKPNEGGGANGGSDNANNQKQETQTTQETFDAMFPKK